MIYIVLIVFGLAFGSFVNALVWRLRQQELLVESRKVSKVKNNAKKSAKSNIQHTKYNIPEERLSVLKGRSMCPSCHHELAAKDLIPVLSWLSLGGKCRYCKKPIHWQYPLVELISALLFVVSYIFWPEYLNFAELQTFSSIFNVVSFGVWLIFLTGLIALFIYDLKWMLLPDRIVFPLIYGALALTILEAVATKSFSPLLSSAIGVLMLAGLFYAIFVVSNGGWIGGGDVKLAIFMGIILGPYLSFLALFLASLVGSFIILGIMALTKVDRKQQIPFGPFLIGATYVAVIWGPAIIDWYNTKFLGGIL